MITYFLIGLLLMFVLEITSEYYWTMPERIWIISLWPIALVIMINAWIKAEQNRKE